MKTEPGRMREQGAYATILLRQLQSCVKCMHEACCTVQADTAYVRQYTLSSAAQKPAFLLLTVPLWTVKYQRSPMRPSIRAI